MGDTDGVVIKIRIRTTTIRSWDRKELLVPNKEFVTGRLLNWSLSDPVTRIVLLVGVAYGSDVERASAIMTRTAQARRFLSSHPRLRVIDVSNAEGAVSGSGPGSLRESPWVSSDVVLSLRYDLSPQERGLVRPPGSPVWIFPDDYLERAGAALDRAESASP